MRLVFDTNIFVSLLIRPGEQFSSFIDFIDQSATVLYSAETLTELIDVMRRRKFSKYTTAEEVAVSVRWVADAGELVVVNQVVTGSRDPNDNKFLALALAGHADFIISGDKDLLTLGMIQSIPIISPANFLVTIKN